MSTKYELIVFKSDEDQSFVVEAPELPGCMADGGTYERAVANAQQVIQEWVETARELGRPIPEPRGRLMLALHRHAADARTSLGEAGVVRCDDIEPLPPGFRGFWVSSPVSIVHLVCEAEAAAG